MTAATATTPTSGAADLPEALRPVEPVALIASIQELNAWEARADGELLTPAEGESIILVLHELKRLLALAAGQATTAQAVVPAGWNLVPTEPTQAMLDAVVTSMDDFLLGKEAEKQYREDWAAMLAAAPADSVQEDAARLDWLLLRISGAEFRRLGVHYSGNARRADVDAARKQGATQ